MKTAAHAGGSGGEYMNIQEACREAQASGQGIYRTSEMKRACVLVPTNTAACVLIFAEHKPYAGLCWNPTLDDLLADDWQVTGRLPEGLRCAAERLQDSV